MLCVKFSCCHEVVFNREELTNNIMVQGAYNGQRLDPINFYLQGKQNESHIS